MMQSITMPKLRSYETALDLNWPVSYWIKPDEVTCRITCHPDSREHEIWLPPLAIANPSLFLPDMVHELCHGKLAEEVDVAFSTLFFARQYGQLQGKAAKEFARKAQFTFWAWAHVDLWVDDLRHEYWPELTEADQASFSQAVLGLAEMKEWEALRAKGSIFGMALQMAEVERRDLIPVGFGNALCVLDTRERATHRTLLEIYRSIPRLTYSREQDLVTLEQSVQRVAQALRFPISPRLVQEEDRMVWYV